MKIIFNDEESAALTDEERNRIITLIKKQGLNEIELSNEQELHILSRNDTKNCFLVDEILLNNLMELQQDALKLEEQAAIVKAQNNYLEEKVNWLRSKVSESNFVPSKAKPESRSSSDSSRLKSALVEVINAMESKVRRSMVFSFSTSKRVKKDKSVISESDYFDNEYMVKQLEDLGLKIKDPLEFFVLFGAELELSPSEKFDTKSYLEMNPDVKDSGINPLLHYIKHGKAEGRVLI